jgi:hypothetical protein
MNSHGDNYKHYDIPAYKSSPTPRFANRSCLSYCFMLQKLLNHLNGRTRDHLIRDKLILSPDMMLRKNYDRKGSVAENNCDRNRQGAWLQDDLI